MCKFIVCLRAYIHAYIHVFRDDKNVFTMRKLQLPQREYELLTRRYLDDGGKTLRIVALYRSLKGDKKEVEVCVCVRVCVYVYVFMCLCVCLRACVGTTMSKCLY